MKSMHMQRGHRLVHLSILKLSRAFFPFFQPDKSKKTMHETRSTVMSNYQIREYSEFIPWMILLNKSQQLWQIKQQRQRLLGADTRGEMSSWRRICSGLNFTRRWFGASFVWRKIKASFQPPPSQHPLFS